jgi:hypothetical protein
MLQLVFMVIFIIAAIIAPRFLKDKLVQKRVYNDQTDRNEMKEKVISLRLPRIMITASCLIIAVFMFASTSFYWVEGDEVGHLKRIYMGKEMPSGRIIAMPDEKGPQARILMPGFGIEAFIRVTHDIEMLPIMEILAGEYGYLIAKDGMPMRDGQFMAPAWESSDDMINALKFMGWTDDKDTYKGPVGTKGPQLTVLRPGKHRVNRYLFSATGHKSTPIATGFVGVIKSNVGEDYTGDPILPTGIEASALSVPIVPKGYRGVWAKVYTPGEYYINKKAYDVTLIDTRVQTWKYLGGYKRRIINLTIGDDGKIEQEKDSVIVDQPKDAVDKAVILRIEGWDVPQDSRVQVQVTPANAPFVVASVGGLKEIENKIITPNYRSIMRNAVAEDVTVTEPKINLETGAEILDSDGKPVMHTVTRRRKVLDLLYQREELETIVSEQLVPAGAKAGLTVQWVRFGDPAVPPELLIPGKRRQLAKQLEQTYEQEKLAQIARVETEKERARADQQATLMKSEIGIKVANNNAEARNKEGIGEKKYFTELAMGQAKQRDVLGKELTYRLAYLDKVLNAAMQNPEIVKIPNILVQGKDGGFEGAAAILGASNLTMGLIKRNTQGASAQ